MVCRLGISGVGSPTTVALMALYVARGEELRVPSGHVRVVFSELHPRANARGAHPY